jgi:hypothetical protein
MITINAVFPQVAVLAKQLYVNRHLACRLHLKIANMGSGRMWGAP